MFNKGAFVGEKNFDHNNYFNITCIEGKVSKIIYAINNLCSHYTIMK